MTAETQRFIEYRKNPTIESRNALVESHLYMVDILIRKYLGKGVEYDDLYQVAALALVQAVERFDPEKGYEFSSFATPTILGEIKKYFRDKQWSLKVPRRLKENAAKVQQAKDDLYLRNFQQPKVPEIAEYTGLSEEQVIQAMEGSKAYMAFSLDKPYEEDGEKGETTFLDTLKSEEDPLKRMEYRELIDQAVSSLDDRQRYVFRERFLYHRSQADIAKTLGVSQMTVSRTEKSIRERFREEMNKNE
ncbi:MAG: SigB/SigF/SigG family RNA polymerase sigma factor [Eubacteriales bacterium]|nr:SigB/SigF/SigG family RNA polymerase sigma factor [Eubacteriales bacterium]